MRRLAVAIFALACPFAVAVTPVSAPFLVAPVEQLQIASTPGGLEGTTARPGCASLALKGGWPREGDSGWRAFLLGLAGALWGALWLSRIASAMGESLEEAKPEKKHRKKKHKRRAAR